MPCPAQYLGVIPTIERDGSLAAGSIARAGGREIDLGDRAFHVARCVRDSPLVEIASVGIERRDVDSDLRELNVRHVGHRDIDLVRRAPGPGRSKRCPWRSL